MMADSEAKNQGKAAFDVADWMRRLHALNPWIEQGSEPLPRRKDWDSLRGHDVNDAFVSWRREACLARRAAGKDAWNSWSDGMQALRQELDDAGCWQIQSLKRPSGENYVYLQRGGREEVVAFIAAAFTDFSGVTFEREADFREWRFPNSTSFDGAVFPGRAIFGGAVFHRGAEFYNAHFMGEALFAGAVFYAGARFGGAVFEASARFMRTRFLASSNFNNVVFHENATFTAAEFKGVSGFSGATFKKEAQLGGAVFNERAIFGRAEFEYRADFQKAVFKRRAVFGGVRFKGMAAFGDAQFETAADFGGARFEHEAAFERAAFRDTAAFRASEFTRRVSFEEATFDGWAGFNDVVFFHRAVLRRAAFKGEAGFSGARFDGRTDFRGAHFHGRTTFLQAQFSGVTTFASVKFDAYTNFEAVQAKEGSSLSLAGSSFGAVPNFIQAHFQEAPRLDNVDINVRRQGGFWSVNRDRDRAARWRSLKRLAIQGHDHARELDFFAAELKARRWVEDLPFPGWWRRPDGRRRFGVHGGAFWTGVVFQLFSNFGRSMLRPVVWWIFFVVLFGAVNLAQHFEERARYDLAGPQSVIAWIADGAPAQSCIAGRGEAAAEALYLSAAKGLVFTGIAGGARTPQTYGCLYGVNGESPTGATLPQQFTPIVPPQISYYATAQLLVSILLITLFLLALRNHFRVR